MTRIVAVRCATSDPFTREAAAEWAKVAAKVAANCSTELHLTFDAGPRANASSDGPRKMYHDLFMYQNIPKAGTNTLSHWFNTACATEFALMAQADSRHLRPLQISALREPVGRSLSGYSQFMYLIVQEAMNTRNLSWLDSKEEKILKLAQTDLYRDAWPFRGSAADWYRALQLGAQIYIGCRYRPVFAAEHMRPIYDLTRGQVDFSFRIEHMAEDQHRFLALLQERTGVKLNQSGQCVKGIGKVGNAASRKPHVDHTFAKDHILADASMTGTTHKILRGVCALYMLDFICNGYELPAPCVAVRGGRTIFPWLENSLSDLLRPSSSP